jgi:hypothetical protein
MDNQPTNSSIPSWFADNQSTPETPTRPPRKPLGSRAILIGSTLALLVLIGGTVWYFVAAHQARITAFTNFRAQYYNLELELVDMTAITEPDDLGTKDPRATWERYTDALTTLTKSPLYTDQSLAPLIDEVRSSSQPFEPFMTGALPAMLKFLSECYVSDDATMYGETCRGYVQSAAASGDDLSQAISEKLLTVLERAAAVGSISSQDAEDILNLQEGFFEVGATVVSTLAPRITTLGEKLGVPSDRIPELK